MDGADTPVLDRTEGLRRVAGDEDLYRDLVQLFLRDLPRILELLDTALAEGAHAALQCAAHSLKGSASQLGARAVAEQAAALEMAAKCGALHEAASLRRRLSEALAHLSAAWSESQRIAITPAGNGERHDQNTGRG